MKKLVALLTALILALSCTPVLAEEAAAAPAVTVTGALTVNHEAAVSALNALGISGDYMKIVDPVLDLLSGLGSRTVVADNGLQLCLTLNGIEIATVGAELTDEGFAIAGTLFPSCLLTVSADTLAQATPAAALLNGGADFGAAGQAIGQYSSEFIAAVMGSVTYGEAESGEFVLDGNAFNTRVPVTVDVKAAMEALRTLANQFTRNESIVAALTALSGAGVSINLDSLTVQEAGDEPLPAVEVNAYTNVDEAGNTDGATYVTTAVTTPGAEAPGTLVDVLVDAGTVKVAVNLPDQGTQFTVNVVPGDTGSNVRVDAVTGGMYVGVAVNVAAGEETVVDSDLYLLDPSVPVLSEHTTVAQGGERTFTVTDPSRTVIAIEDMMADESGEIVNQLLSDVQSNGLASLISAATAAAPDAVTNLMALFITPSASAAE